MPVPGGPSGDLSITTYVARSQVPVLAGLDGAGDDPHVNTAAFENPVSCVGIFEGQLRPRDGGTRPDLDATATGPGGEYELNEDRGINAGAPPGEYTIRLECTQRFLGVTLNAEPASFTVTITEPSAPGSGTNPALSNVQTEPILFKQRDARPAHGVTGADGTPDRTGAMLPPQTIDSAHTNET